MGNLLYVNIHGSFSPPSPMGSIAGWLTAVNPLSPATGVSVPPGPQIGVPCTTLVALPLQSGYQDFTIKLDYVYSSFNCRDFPSLLAGQMSLTAAEVCQRKAFCCSVVFFFCRKGCVSFLYIWECHIACWSAGCGCC
jgi:hypothetical protein